jgi:hypothetical protein
LEGEIRRILVPGQPGQKQFARPHLNGKKLGFVAPTYHLKNGDGRKGKIGGLRCRLAWAKKQDPISRITVVERTDGVVQAVKFLTCKHEVLSSNPKTTTNK